MAALPVPPSAKCRSPRHRGARLNLRSVEILKILPQTTKLTDTKNILQVDALITFTEKDIPNC